ncbi:hypothetical protein BT69DRAFT_675492 [Atractiella rhizophila]|nr:hypothetical protein BT69DRAFT_675492 [Atractiella rhizophila]
MKASIAVSLGLFAGFASARPKLHRERAVRSSHPDPTTNAPEISTQAISFANLVRIESESGLVGYLSEELSAFPELQLRRILICPPSKRLTTHWLLPTLQAAVKR